MKPVLRILAAFGLLALLAFCLFGFLAAFEPAGTSRRPWQVGYALLGVGCVAGIIGLLRPRKPTRPGDAA